jgi:hypothetical protein
MSFNNPVRNFKPPRKYVETPESINRNDLLRRLQITNRNNSNLKIAAPAVTQKKSAFDLRQATSFRPSVHTQVLGHRINKPESKVENKVENKVEKKVENKVENKEKEKTKDNETLVKELEALKEYVDKVEKALQKNIVNIDQMLQKQYEGDVQVTSFRTSLGSLAQELAAIKPQAVPSPTPPIWATSLQELKTYESPSMPADEDAIIMASERVMLQYPVVTYDDGNEWIKCFRLFDSGIVKTKWCHLKTDGENNFKSFTFSSELYKPYSCTHKKQ